MKITLNMDDDLLERVMARTGAPTKTEAIHMALRELDRRANLVDVLREGTGASREELRLMFDAESAPDALRAAEPVTPYRTKPNS